MPVISKFDYDNFYDIFFKGEPNIMKKPFILDHPLVQHKLSILRRTTTGTKDFRELISEIGTLLCYEATRDLELEPVEIETPMCKCTAKQLKGKAPVIVPILRAGLGMVDGVQNLIPSARVGHIGLYRDEETAQPVEYFCKLPVDIADCRVFLVDPMLATGGSAIDAIGQLKKRGVKEISFLCIIAAPEGLEKLNVAHPDVQIYCAALDERLNEVNYILPGLGDAGDRIFGTK